MSRCISAAQDWLCQNFNMNILMFSFLVLPVLFCLAFLFSYIIHMSLSKFLKFVI